MGLSKRKCKWKNQIPFDSLSNRLLNLDRFACNSFGFVIELKCFRTELAMLSAACVMIEPLRKMKSAVCVLFSLGKRKQERNVLEIRRDRCYLHGSCLSNNRVKLSNAAAFDQHDDHRDLPGSQLRSQLGFEALSAIWMVELVHHLPNAKGRSKLAWRFFCLPFDTVIAYGF